MARLDRLASARDVAQIAAAIGREFSYELLAAVAGLMMRSWNWRSRLRVRSELIFRRGAPRVRATFSRMPLPMRACYTAGDGNSTRLSRKQSTSGFRRWRKPNLRSWHNTTLRQTCLAKR